MLANINSILASESGCRVSLRYTHVGLPTQFRFNVGLASQSIAGLMSTNCLRRWPSTTPTLVICILSASTYPSKHSQLPMFPCWPNVSDAGPKLKQHCVIVPQMSSTCIPSTTIAGAGQHSFNTCLRCT